jgi:GT2 family glycosyltransferase
MAIAKGRYVLLLNSDTTVLDGAVHKAVGFADSHAHVAVVGCRVLSPDRTVQRSCFMFPSVVNMLLSSSYLYKLFPKNWLFGREQMTWWNKENVYEVDVIAGCFMLVRREAINQVGLMDERFFMYGEETDWCYRFKQAGWKVVFAPIGEIIHLGAASSRQARPEMILQLRASILLFFKKHRGWLSYKLACFLVGLFFLLRLPFWSGRAVFSRSTRHSDLQTVKTYAAGAIKAMLGWEALCFVK